MFVIERACICMSQIRINMVYCWPLSLLLLGASTGVRRVLCARIQVYRCVWVRECVKLLKPFKMFVLVSDSSPYFPPLISYVQSCVRACNLHNYMLLRSRPAPWHCAWAMNRCSTDSHTDPPTSPPQKPIDTPR